MSSKVELKDLIEALAGAVIEAQDRIEQHQIVNLSSYFDSDNRPKSVLIRLPSLTPGAEEGSEDLYRAPLLPLVSTNLLKIKDVEISFDVDLGAIGDGGSEAPSTHDPSQSAWQSLAAGVKKSVQVHTTGPLVGKRSTAHVVLRVEGTEPTEGVARLLNQLTQVQGVFKTLKP
jgi:hypothetical protein